MIPIRYKYKTYQNAPRATAKSKALGVMTSFTAMVLWAFLCMSAVNWILSRYIGIKDDTAFMIGLVSVIPFVYVVMKWKKRAILKIDEEAAAEMAGK